MVIVATFRIHQAEHDVRSRIIFAHFRKAIQHTDGIFADFEPQSVASPCASLPDCQAALAIFFPVRSWGTM